MKTNEEKLTEIAKVISVYDEPGSAAEAIEDAMSGGNFDDCFYAGEDYGESSLASEIREILKQ